MNDMDLYKVFQKARYYLNYKKEEFLLISKDDVLNAFIQWLNSNIKSDYVDPEMFMESGELLNKTDHKSVDKKILNWLNDDDNPNKIIMACSFLCGYWIGSSPETIYIDKTLRILDNINHETAIIDTFSTEYEAYSNVLYLLLHILTLRNLDSNYRDKIRKLLHSHFKNVMKGGKVNGIYGAMSTSYGKLFP